MMGYLVEKLKMEVARLEVALLSGGVSSYEEYRIMLGEKRAYEHAIEIANDLEGMDEDEA